jgi:ribA/ribD-fused uncharacterized protein
MKTIIDSFDSKYAFLSNFFPCIIEFDGNDFPSVEHAFQAAKTRDKQEQFKIWQAATPGKAKREGRKVTLREDWEEIKRDYMKEFIHQKFQDEALRKMLLATGDAELIEGNYWNDTYWGVCNGVGQNWLGKILMEERRRIKNENIV